MQKSRRAAAAAVPQSKKKKSKQKTSRALGEKVQRFESISLRDVIMYFSLFSLSLAKSIENYLVIVPRHYFT